MKIKITPILKSKIESDIELCENHTDIKGSQHLYGELVASYSVLDPDFKQNLSTNNKSAVIGSEFDYRPELRAIAAKLKMYLITADTESTNPLQDKIQDFLCRGVEIEKKEFHPGENGFPFSYISGPMYDSWMAEIKIFTERYLQIHPLYGDILKIYSNHNKNPSAFEDMMGYLHALATDNAFFNSTSVGFKQIQNKDMKMKEKVFIVHGHDSAALQETARTLERLGFEAIILHEQPDTGFTIIEKIERYTDVAFAVVLYTECDLGRDKEAKPNEEKFRARQNVVFEHGYLIAKLGRERICALVKGNVETPGDIEGVVYIPMDNGGAWKTKIVTNMKAVGLQVDANKLF